VNAKLKTALDHLLKTADEGAGCIDDPHSRVASKLFAAVDAVRKLVNPPVRLAWYRTFSDGSYRAVVGVVTYTIRRASGKRLAWRTVVSVEGSDVKALYFPTLALAKQACVDYDVARHRAAAKSAQLHTDPAIRKALTPSPLPPLTRRGPPC
jgi:hypothetical protein